MHKHILMQHTQFSHNSFQVFCMWLLVHGGQKVNQIWSLIMHVFTSRQKPNFVPEDEEKLDRNQLILFKVVSLFPSFPLD